MYNDLYDHQKEGVGFLTSKKDAYLAFKMRLGKTPTSIVSADQCFALNILVVCKATAKFNWQREFNTWQVINRDVTVISGTKATIPTAGVVIINYDLVIYDRIKKQLLAARWDVLVLDEAQFLSNPKAKRTRVVLGHKMNPQHGIVGRADRVWPLSGTPMLNSPIDLWPILYSVFPQYITPRNSKKPLTYWGFARTFCELYENDYGTRIGGGKNLDKLNKLLSHFMLVKQTVPGLPEHRAGEISLSPADKAVQKAIAELPGTEELEEAIAVGKDFTDSEFELSTLRRHIATVKAPLLAELIKEEIEAGLQKIVIFSYHTKPIEILLKEFKTSAVKLVGGMTDKAKDDAVRRFQTDPACKVFLGQIVAAGDSINLDISDDIVFLEQDWVPAINEQASCRCDAIGGKSVMVRFCTLTGSVDEHVQRTLAMKNKVINQVILEKEKQQ